MPNAADVRWFKEQFHTEIERAVAGTLFDLDFLTALACQETGEVWPILRRQPSLSVDQIVALCVGDTIDGSGGRGAFPTTKAELIAKPNGQRMFDIARQGLVDMAAFIPSYRSSSARPAKFVHGFGVWQYDLQFFLTDPEYFLQKKYEKLEETLAKAIGELEEALKRVGFQNKPSLTDFEMACVAIAYNTGRFVPSRGLKQGFKDSDGRFYGEMIFDFIKLARSVPLTGAGPAEPPAGNTSLPDPTPISAAGAAFLVDTKDSPLRLRSAPEISDPSGANVVAQLPDGQPVRAVTGKKVNGFLEVETSLAGAHLQGFAATKFLVAAPAATSIPIMAAAPTLPTTGIVAVFAPRPTGSITRRADPADAHSLNEPGQPGRAGTTPEELVTEINAIVDWLAVDKASNARYQPHDGLTFCNIYTHDFCHLAGAYLPRVWWTPKSLIALSHGEAVDPRVGATVDEMRANDLFRWLRDFGPTFGWRQTGTLSKLQSAANQGGLGLIVARRKEDGRSGHIVMVIPESSEQSARRDASGEVIAPVQSQAGARNFRRGTSTLNWWNDDRFAESAFYIHA